MRFYRYITAELQAHGIGTAFWPTLAAAPGI